MNLKRMASRVAYFVQIIENRGLIFFLHLVVWFFKTRWLKLWIRFEDRCGLFSYVRWIRENEARLQPSVPGKPESIFSETEELHAGQRVRLSFVIPYRWGSSLRVALLAQTIRSLLAQTSPAWEVCLFGEKSEVLSSSIAGLAASEADCQGHIRWLTDLYPGEDGLSNALANARGEWVMLLSPGDTVSPEICVELAQLAQQPASPEIVYFDQDQLGADGSTRKNPLLRPDWSPELLLSVNYLENACFRREILRSCLEQSQGSGEAVLRCVEQARQIVHVPRLLYHQANMASTDGLFSLKFTAADAAAHLQRLGVAQAQAVEDALKRVRFSWPARDQLVSIIIPSRDHREYLERCITSIHHLTRYRNYEIVIVDNNSQQAETLAYYAQLQQMSNITILQNRTPFNYSAYNNLGVRHARGDLLLFLNNDVEVIDSGWLDELVQWAAWSEIGAVGAKLLYLDGTIQHAGIVVGMEGHGSHIFMGVREGYNSLFGSVEWYRDVSAVTGACLMMRRDVFEQIGGFDENYILAFNDIEICVRVLAHGYRVLYNPFARLIHYEGKSRGRYIPSQDIRLGYEHLKDYVRQGDPFYNPNLSYAVCLPTLCRRSEQSRAERLAMIRQYMG